MDVPQGAQYVHVLTKSFIRIEEMEGIYSVYMFEDNSWMHCFTCNYDVIKAQVASKNYVPLRIKPSVTHHN